MHLARRLGCLGGHLAVHTRTWSMFVERGQALLCCRSMTLPWGYPSNFIVVHGLNSNQRIIQQLGSCFLSICFGWLDCCLEPRLDTCGSQVQADEAKDKLTPRRTCLDSSRHLRMLRGSGDSGILDPNLDGTDSQHDRIVSWL